MSHVLLIMLYILQFSLPVLPVACPFLRRRRASRALVCYFCTFFVETKCALPRHSATVAHGPRSAPGPRYATVPDGSPAGACG
jgi:hypothetical protein